MRIRSVLYRPPVANVQAFRRPGFSLIEIIIATAILMGSVIVLARLAGMGRTMAQKSDVQSSAQRICEQTLSEIVLGERPLEAVDRSVLEPVTHMESSLEETPRDERIALRTSSARWQYTVFVTPLRGLPTLTRVTVTVELLPTTQPTEQSVSESPTANRGRFTLSRWIRTDADAGSNQGAFNVAGGF